MVNDDHGTGISNEWLTMNERLVNECCLISELVSVMINDHLQD